MKIKDPNGNFHNVTEKAFRVVYAPLGYTDASKDVEPEGTASGKEGNATLTVEEFDEAMKNRANVEKKLADLGVDFDAAAKAEELKTLLKSELQSRELVPDGR